MIIRTRYRDIPSSEIRHDKEHQKDLAVDAEWDSSMRGKEISIKGGNGKAPFDYYTEMTSVCSGPFFEVVNGPIENCWVCSHLAEIGD